MARELEPAAILDELQEVLVFNSLSEFQQQTVLRLAEASENEVLTLQEAEWLERLHRIYIGT